MQRLNPSIRLAQRIFKTEFRCLTTAASKPLLTPSLRQNQSSSSVFQHSWSRKFATEAKEEANTLEEVEEEEQEVEFVEETTDDVQDADDVFFRGPPLKERISQFPELYSGFDELIAVTESDVGKWFQCDEGLLVQHPLNSKWINKSVHDMFDMTGKYMMMRQPSFDLISALNEIAVNADAERGAVIGVYGRPGVGKSCTLHTLNQAALQDPDKWLTIGFHARDVCVDHFGFLFPSTTREGKHYQGRWCKNFFTNLLETQGNLLKKVSLKREYTYDWILRGETAHLTPIELEQAKLQMDAGETDKLEGKTLHDIAVFGRNDSAIAGECFYDFVEEVLLADEIHTLVTLDGINIWDEKSEFRDPGNPFKKLECRQLSAVDAVSKFMTQAPKNGMSVFATTSSATLNMSKKHMADATYALEVPAYSSQELSNCIWHYKTSRFVFAEVDVFLLARIKGMTGGVAKEVFNDCTLI